MGIFDGKTAIITGGGKAKSIGYGIATAYAKEGANLVLTGRNEQKLLDAKEELERLYGIKVLAMQAEVTPDDEAEDRVKEVVKTTIKTFGRIDVLINNAQASASGIPLSMQTRDHFDLGIYSGLYATFYYMRECYPYLKKTQGQSSTSPPEPACSAMRDSAPTRRPRRASGDFPGWRPQSGARTISMSTWSAPWP